MDRSFLGHQDKDWYNILYNTGKQKRIFKVITSEIKFKKIE